MKKQILLLFSLIITGFSFAQSIAYSVCDNCWDADSLGNHRVVLNYNGQENIAKAVVPWRRRDMHPEQKRIIVQDAKTGNKILNVKTGTLNREYGEIFFEPVSGKGQYYIYYMPYKNEGRANYPKGTYLLPEHTASQEFLQKTQNVKEIKLAFVESFQSIDSFNSFYPMEVIATDSELIQLKKEYEAKSFIVFPENRSLSIRMTDNLPQRWIENRPVKVFKDSAQKGEQFAYQLGVYALRDLKNVHLSFSDLKSKSGTTIPANSISNINTSGTSYDNRPLQFKVEVPKGKVQALWCLVPIPLDAEPGMYSGTVQVSAENISDTWTIPIEISVATSAAIRGGADAPWEMTRLAWLNSTLAQENTVIAPYIPLTIQNNSIDLLGRKIVIGANGLPSRIQTFFTEEMTGVGKKANDIIQRPFAFIAQGANGPLQWKNEPIQWIAKEAGTAKWKVLASAKGINAEINGSLEFDGFGMYSIKIIATEDIDLVDLRLEIPLASEAARYMMGLGQKGGNMPQYLQWKWDVANKNQDGAWVGNTNRGIQFSLRDEHYVRPLNTNFYLQKPLLLPVSWGNSGKGGINIIPEKDGMLINSYSGARHLKKGDSLFFNFTLLITPFHALNTDFQWDTRFYHAYKPIDTIKKIGATIVNIHHGNEINPWINYPFIAWEKMKSFIDSAHAAGLKVKIYNTVRELSNHAYETFALRSLGHEIYAPGKGGGFSWLQEHLESDYIAAWFVPEWKDAAIINSGMNRWHNYYVEGMNWLTQNVGIDGIYLDDVAFDRTTMKRIKRVLTKDGHPGIIDLHSANQFNKNDGFNNSANLYMEHFPYLNRLWFGEYFDYEKNDPDFYMTEISGIPFGLMGEMLQDGGNSYRGMIYGMTNRIPWSDNADPRPIWKIWDSFGMAGSNMIGYWVANNPVQITHASKVLATVYSKNKKALVSVASWEDTDKDIILSINWKKLGLDPSKVTITAPKIERFQPERVFKLGESIPVEKNKGWLLIIQEK